MTEGERYMCAVSNAPRVALQHAADTVTTCARCVARIDANATLVRELCAGILIRNRRRISPLCTSYSAWSS